MEIEEKIDTLADNVGHMLSILDISRVHYGKITDDQQLELWDNQIEVTKEILNELTLLKHEVESLKTQMEKFNPIGGQ